MSTSKANLGSRESKKYKTELEWQEFLSAPDVVDPEEVNQIIANACRQVRDESDASAYPGIRGN